MFYRYLFVFFYCLSRKFQNLLSTKELELRIRSNRGQFDIMIYWKEINYRFSLKTEILFNFVNSIGN